MKFIYKYCLFEYNGRQKPEFNKIVHFSTGCNKDREALKVDLLADASQNLIDPSACLKKEKEYFLSFRQH